MTDDAIPRGHPAPSVVAIGTSAGGLAAMRELLRSIPGSLPFPMLLVQHLSRSHKSQLTELLRAYTDLDVSVAEEGVPTLPGHVYVAPPDHHLEVDAGGCIHLTQGPPVNFARPAVDVLFRSLARSFGARGLAIVLTGAGSDGARGASAVHDAGGLVLAQSEASALSFGMPGSAIRAGAVDRVLALDEIARFLAGFREHERPA